MLAVEATVTLVALMIWIILGVSLWLCGRRLLRTFEHDDLLLLHLYSLTTQVEVDPHDEIRLSQMKSAQNHDQALRKRRSVALSFAHLGFFLSSGQCVLKNVSGFIRPGLLTAVMGPSGSGKTTFLNVLSGRASYGRQVGDVFVNGVRDNIERYKKVVGFVPQDDTTIHGELSVREILSTSAATRLPDHFSAFQREMVLEETMALLDLSDVRFSQAGTATKRGLSGGQRRRLSVGIELAAQPLVLFLDEPTSGLDSSAASSLCSALQTLAHTGLTVAAVIHQPRYEIFCMFDDVLLLGKGGQTVYQGEVTGLQPYFARIGYHVPDRVNPADYFMDIVAGDARPTDVDKTKEAVVRARIKLMDGEEPDPDRDLRGEMDELSDRDLAVPEMLFELWRAHTLGQVPVSEHLPMPKSVRNSRSLGTKVELWKWALATLLVPWLLCLIYLGEMPPPRLEHVRKARQHIRRDRDDDDDDDDVPLLNQPSLNQAQAARAKTLVKTTGRSLNARFGALMGTCTCYTAIGLVFLIYGATTNRGLGYVLAGCGIMIMGMVVMAWVALSYNDSIHRQSRRKATFLGNFLVGVGFGPFCVLLVWMHMSEKARAAITTGGMFTSVMGVLILAISLTKDDSANETVSILSWIAGGCVVLSALGTALLRYHHLPHEARRTSGFFFQTYVFALRGLRQMMSNWQGVVLDLGLNLLSGLFLGLVFYQRTYQGPVLSPFGVDVGKTFVCPEDIATIFPPACGLLIVPMDDPIPGQASLSCLAVAMAAMASSMRVFGDEINIFTREAGVGLHTGAYYIGKSLAHLPIVVLAPAIFLFSFVGLAGIAGSWFEHYMLLLAVYTITSGIAYVISVVTPRELSQLIGVISLLICMMFSGANPTLLQLQSNALLGRLLYYPSFGSFLRFAQEQYYLIEARAHHVSEASMGSLYGYQFTDERVCIAFLLFFAFVFRLVAYNALVVRENLKSSGQHYTLIDLTVAFMSNFRRNLRKKDLSVHED